LNDRFLNDFGKVFEAWDQPATTNPQTGWTYVPTVGTYPSPANPQPGYNSHISYDPAGNADHYSVYNNGVLIERSKI
jgi:hypothetical protein